MTRRDAVYCGVAFICSGLAAFGGMQISRYFVALPRALDNLTPWVGVIVFFAAFWLMLKGVDAIKSERIKKEIAELEREWRLKK